MDNKDQFKGKVKQAVGDLTGDEDLKKEGKVDEKAGRVNELLEEAKDKAEDLIGTVKDKFLPGRWISSSRQRTLATSDSFSCTSSWAPAVRSLGRELGTFRRNHCTSIAACSISSFML